MSGLALTSLITGSVLVGFAIRGFFDSWRSGDPYKGYTEKDNEIDNKTHEFWIELEHTRPVQDRRCGCPEHNANTHRVPSWRG